MKRILFSFLLLYSACSAYAHISVMNISQLNTPVETLDSAYLKVSYSLTFIQDINKPEKSETDEMLLLVGGKVSQFFSYARFQADSMLRTMAPEQAMESFKNMKRGKFTYDIFKNYPEGKITSTEKIAMTDYKYEEPYEKPNWEIADDTKDILGYTCQKATCMFRGRNYEAWFTMDIPVSNGPWKFAGLPGLILNIADTDNHYVFECSGIETPKEKIVIGIKKNNYA